MNNSHFHKINTTTIILLPKKDRAIEISDFRPISLIHSIVKILSKLLSLRLSKYMDALIWESQSAFVKKRTIQDNFLYMQTSPEVITVQGSNVTVKIGHRQGV